MKFIIKIAAVFFIGLFSNSLAHSKEKKESLPNGIEVAEIGDQVFVATDKTFHNSNVLIVKLADGTVFIASSPFENLGTESLMKWVTQKLKPKKVVAINTHYHLDGTSGNAVYHKYGVETWASDHTDRLHREAGRRIRKSAAESFKDKDLSKRILNTEIVSAKFLFDEENGKKFKFPDETVQVYFPGASHSPDHVVVFFENRKILFGGCMVKPGKTLGYLGDADVKSWVQAAGKLFQFNVKTVVPGHHKPGDRKLIDKTIENAKLKISKIK